MKVGIDYWQVLSHYPEYFCMLIKQTMSSGSNEVHIISAIGKNRVGTIQSDVDKVLLDNGLSAFKPYVHEVVFDRSYKSPEKKLEKCLELGIDVFYDDRGDVCRLLHEHGILTMRVTRIDGRNNDIQAERPDSESHSRAKKGLNAS